LSDKNGIWPVWAVDKEHFLKAVQKKIPKKTNPNLPERK